MKLKLDENLGKRGRCRLERAGHDVSSVVEQGLQSATDRELIVRCAEEGRGLVTLDLDFANPLVFPPTSHAGVSVLRLPREPTSADMDAAFDTLTAALRSRSFHGALWIVEAGRVRVYSPES